MIGTMYNLASAGDQIAAESNGTKQLRYGNATDIAKQFEKYVKGLQGYVLKNASAKKTVALVKNCDAASGTYELVPTGVAEGTATWRLSRTSPSTWAIPRPRRPRTTLPASTSSCSAASRVRRICYGR